MTLLPRSKVISRFYLPLAMGVLVLGLYVSSLDNPFILDDHAAIVDNPDVSESQGILTLWVRDFWAGRRVGQVVYRPITAFSLYLNAQLAGLSPLAFRVVNIALLGLLGWIVAAWLSRYTVYKTVAWLGSLLFVAHPAHAEMINHIVGRAELLAMIGVVGFLLLHIRALETVGWRGGDQISRTKRCLGTSAAALAGLITATVAFFSSLTGLLLIPAVVVQAALWRSKYYRKAPRPPGKGDGFVHALAGVCLTIPAVTFWSGRAFAARVIPVSWNPTQLAPATDDLAHNPLLSVNLVDRVPAALSLVWFYTRQVIWPDTSYSHVPTNWPTMTSVSVIFGTVVVVWLVVMLVILLSKRHWLCMAPTLVLGQLVLVTGLWLERPVYASNQLVMPMTLAATMCMTSVIAYLTGHSLRKRAVAVIPCAVLLLMMYVTVLGINARWFSTPRLMASDLQRRPHNPVLMYNYAGALIQAGVYENAIFWLNLAIELKPRSIGARHKLAQAYHMRGDFTAARRQYQQILNLEPYDVPSRIHLAELAIDDKDFETAARHVAEAQKTAPTHAEVMYSRAKLALLRGDLDAALLRYEVLLALYPSHELGRRDLLELQVADTTSLSVPGHN